MLLRIHSRKIWLLPCLALLLLTGPALAGEKVAEEAAPEETAPQQNLLPVTFAGVQVFVDAETGRLRPPTTEEAAELSAAMKAMFATKAKNAEPVMHKNGMMSLVVGTDHLSFSTAHIDEAGQLHLECVNGIDDAAEHLTRLPVSREEM